MASRPLLTPFPVITNGDMSTTLHSLPTVITNLSMLSYEISWAGSAPAGTVTVEVSNSYSQNGDGSVRNPGNWTAITLSSPTTVSGNTGVGFIDIEALAAHAVRLTYTPASGTGLMNVIVSGKVQ